MKQPYMILPLLIPGPSSPSNEIDVYLRPLINELKELLFDGLSTSDNSTNETFKMRHISWEVICTFGSKNHFGSLGLFHLRIQFS